MGLGQIATLFSALFELLIASKMITAPDKLLGGHVPAPGFEYSTLMTKAFSALKTVAAVLVALPLAIGHGRASPQP